MRFQEIAEKVKSGEITLDYCGHRTNDTFLYWYNNTVEGASGKKDGVWNVSDGKWTMEEANARMRGFFQRKLDWEVGEDESCFPLEAEPCFGCGEKLKWVLNGNKLTLREYFKNGATFKDSDFVNHPLDYRCPFEDETPFTGEIKILSPMLVANFFRNFNDEPEDQRHTSEWNINYRSGRQNVTNHLCSQNVAYGQMGNMSIGVYVNAARDSVIIGPRWHPAEFAEFDSDDEWQAAMEKPVFEGYEQVGGGVSLAVWRWEASDKLTVGEEELKAIAEEGRDLVELDVKLGRWRFEHFYDRSGLDEPEDHVYSRFSWLGE